MNLLNAADVGIALFGQTYDVALNWLGVIVKWILGIGFLFLLMQVDRIRKYSKETKDEMAIQNLRRADAICLKIMIVAAVVIAFAGAITLFDGIMAGYALVGTILAVTIIRFIIFCIMDSKGV